MQTSYKTMEQNNIKYMLQFVEEYEKIKRKEPDKYSKVKEFFADKGICFQNFYKFYNRYIRSNRDEKALLPIRRGPKPKYQDAPVIKDEVERIILEYRSKGYNKFIIAEALKKDHKVKNPCSASTIYRIFKKHEVNRLRQKLSEEKQKIVREYMGSLGHVDCHFYNHIKIY